MDNDNGDNETFLSSSSGDEEVENYRGCASSYLVEERENSKKHFTQNFRTRWTKAAGGLAVISFIATIVFSLAAFITSKGTESSAVFAAGFDAFFAAINVVAVLWRFRDDVNGDIGPKREKAAASVIAASFILGGSATLAISLYHLKINDHPKKTYEMLIVLGIGFVIYLILCSLQCHIAAILQSVSMKALAVDSGLAAAMDAGLLLSSWLFREEQNLWFLDHAFAGILGFISSMYGLILVFKVVELSKMKGTALFSPRK